VSSQGFLLLLPFLSFKFVSLILSAAVFSCGAGRRKVFEVYLVDMDETTEGKPHPGKGRKKEKENTHTHTQMSTETAECLLLFSFNFSV